MYDHGTVEALKEQLRAAESDILALKEEANRLRIENTVLVHANQKLIKDINKASNEFFRLTESLQLTNINH